MSRQSEFKMKYNPELGKFTKQHIWGSKDSIHGEGFVDMFKLIGSKLFGKTMKKAAKKSGEKVLTMAATKTGEHAGKKAGDKIVKMLSKENKQPIKNPPVKKDVQIPNKNIAQKEINRIVNTIPNKNIAQKEINRIVNTIPNKNIAQKEINRRVNTILSGGKII